MYISDVWSRLSLFQKSGVKHHNRPNPIYYYFAIELFKLIMSDCIACSPERTRQYIRYNDLHHYVIFDLNDHEEYLLRVKMLQKNYGCVNVYERFLVNKFFKTCIFLMFVQDCPSFKKVGLNTIIVLIQYIIILL
jgi:hypothetical protein